MPNAFISGVTRFVLWDYQRGGWQYDVMVGIILAFIFLTPREWFRDQPRMPRASNIAVLPAEHGSEMYLVDADLLNGIPEQQWRGRLGEILKKVTGKKQVVVTRIQPIYDEAEGELKGYIAFANP